MNAVGNESNSYAEPDLHSHLEGFPNSENSTDYANMTNPQLRTAFDVIVIFCMLSIMFAMGCEVTVSEIINHFRKPSGILIGMVSQFLVLPLLGFLAIKIFMIKGVYATSVLIMSCSPGGGYSNLITYLSKGDVSLSVAMTTVSNVLALGFTPLNVWIYSNGVETGDIKIPFKQMSISMFILSAIVACGVILRWKYPKAATLITKVGVICSGILAVACGVLALVLYPKFFQNIPPILFYAVAFVGPFGLIVAYCLAWIFKQKQRIRRTIAIESAVQNVGTAITIVIISFSKSALQKMSVYIILYAGMTTVIMLLLAGGLAVYERCNENSTKNETKVEGKEAIELDVSDVTKFYTEETSHQK